MVTSSVDQKLLEKLGSIAARRDELERSLADPTIASDPVRSISISKEMGKLRQLTDPFRKLECIRTQLNEAREIIADPAADSDLRSLAQGELADLEDQYETQLEHLKECVVTAEDATISSIIMEIRAGTGGNEAALFARDLYEMYLRFCEARGFKVEVLDQSSSDLGGLKDIVLGIKGDRVWQALGYEGGGHRVQRVPETEAQGRVHTSAATVAVFPEPEEINVDINWDTDVEEHVARASGPGGQKVNKTSSAIKLVHRDSGISVSIQDEKSQHKNRAKARRILTSRLFDLHQRKQDETLGQARRTMIGSGDRSERIRTYNFPQNRCSDHRINSRHNLDKIMRGEMDDLIEDLQTHDKEQRLKNL